MGVAPTGRSSMSTRRSHRTRRIKSWRFGKRSWRRRRLDGRARAAPLVLRAGGGSRRPAHVPAARRRAYALQVRGGRHGRVGSHRPRVDAPRLRQPGVVAARAASAGRAVLAGAGARGLDAAVRVDWCEYDAPAGGGCWTLAVAVSALLRAVRQLRPDADARCTAVAAPAPADRKSTRLNSS